jgi:hypothetical protein
VDLSREYRIYSFTYLTRQDGVNGRIKDYELYISSDPFDWGEPVSTGSFENTAAPQTIDFPDGLIGQYFRLLALSEVNGNAWASAAEFTMVGCTDITFGIKDDESGQDIKAFPVPSNGKVCISLPTDAALTYQIFSNTGQLYRKGKIAESTQQYCFELETFSPGIYFIRLKDERGVVYNVKVIKN